jgi:hypothetical protein
MPYTYDVFVSYSRADAAWAAKLAADLTARGISVFFDQARITAGEAWETRLAVSVQASRNLVVLWSDNAAASAWVRREMGLFEAIQHLGQGAPDPERRLIMVNLVGENTSVSSVQRIDDLRDAVKNGADAATVDGGLWNRVVGKVEAGLHASDPRSPVPLAIFAMTCTELTQVNPNTDPGNGKTFAQVVGQLGFAVGEGGPDLAVRYGNARGGWRPFGGEQTIDEILDGIVGKINSEMGPPGYRWQPVDLMAGTNDDARTAVAAFCSGPAAVVVDPLSLYHPTIKFRYELLRDCAKNEHALVAAFTPVSPPSALLALRELTRDLAGSLVDAYYRPPIPRHPHPLVAVNVSDRPDMDRLVRSCIGRFVGERQTLQSNAFLRPG